MNATVGIIPTESISPDQNGSSELRQIWQKAREKNGPYVSADEVMKRLERKCQALQTRLARPTKDDADRLGKAGLVVE